MNSPQTIIAATAAVTGVPVAAITGKRRTRQIAYARFLAIAAIRAHHSWWTLQEIADIFRRDHGTIIWATARHSVLLGSDATYARFDREIREDLAIEILKFHAV